MLARYSALYFYSVSVVKFPMETIYNGRLFSYPLYNIFQHLHCVEQGQLVGGQLGQAGERAVYLVLRFACHDRIGVVAYVVGKVLVVGAALQGEVNMEKGVQVEVVVYIAQKQFGNLVVRSVQLGGKRYILADRYFVVVHFAHPLH